jgi:hypothetical protein
MGRVTFVSRYPGRVISASIAIGYTKDEALNSEENDQAKIEALPVNDSVIFQLELMDEDTEDDLVIDLDQKIDEIVDALKVKSLIIKEEGSNG